MPYDYVRKLQAMMAKAESTPSSAEADSILQKVREMMDRHGVSLVDLATHLSDDPVGIMREAAHFWNADNWARGLYGACGRYFGCRVYFTKRGNNTEVIINGRESCRATFLVMGPYLFRAVRRLADHAYKAGVYSHVSHARRDIGKALMQRLDTLWAEAERAALARGPRSARGFNALVPVDILDTVENDAFGEVKATGGKRKGTTRAGHLLAAQINLAEQLGEVIPKERPLK